MPISAAYTWEQTRENIVVHVSLKGTAKTSVDIYVSDLFLKVNFSPYLLAVDLYDKVNYEKSVARFDQRDGQLHLTLPKETPQEWKDLTFQIKDSNMNKSEKKKFINKRRGDAMARKRTRDEEIKELIKDQRRANEKMTLRKQMALEEGERQNIEELKEEEKSRAEKEMYQRFKEMEMEERQRQKNKKSNQKSNTISQNLSSQTSAGNTSKSGEDDNGKTPTSNGIVSESVNVIIEKEQKNISTSSDIFDDDDIDDGSNKTKKVEEEEEELEEELYEDDDIKYIPAPRETQKIQIKHTERFFPTPLRESKIREEEDWLAKNASHVGRRLGEKRKPGDTRDISERDPFWIKGKGDDFFRAKDFKSAINAYSAALDIDETMIPALSNRSNCWLQLDNYDKCVEDCITLLEKVKGTTPAERKLMTAKQLREDVKTQRLRVKVLVRLGSAYCKLGKYHDAIQYYEDGIRLTGLHQGLKGQIPLDPLWDDLDMIRRLNNCAILKETADRKFKEKNIAEALENYNEALAIEPGYVSILSNRASVQLALGKWEGAIKDCKQALGLLGVIDNVEDIGNINPVGPLPQKGSARFNMWSVKTLARCATAKSKLGMYDEALGDLRQALDLDPDNVSLQTDIQKIQVLQGKITDDEQKS
eukprot:g1365.t1